MKSLRNSAVAGILALAFMHTAQAGVIIGGTRVIYDGSKSQASLEIRNPDSSPYLIQTWLEPEAGSTQKPPFVVTPPLYRLDANQKNSMRIVRAGALDETKESLFWMNIKSIPSSGDQVKGNTLQIAVKTRIKLIYRPASLKKKSDEDLAKQLRFTVSGNQLTVTNPTLYYANFSDIQVGGKSVSDISYAPPQGSVSFKLSSGMAGAVQFKLINDYGGASAFIQGAS